MLKRDQKAVAKQTQVVASGNLKKSKTVPQLKEESAGKMIKGKPAQASADLKILPAT